MRSARYRRRNIRPAIIFTAIALILLSLTASAFMQSNVNPAARKRSTRIPINLASVPSAPLAQIITDGGFEAGFPHPGWPTQSSTNFGSPLCDGGCGTGSGTAPPRTGNFWAWFGGIDAPETATVGQTVNFPAGETVKNLVFWMRIGSVGAPFTDVLNVRVDGNIVASFPEPTVAETAYTPRLINLNSFAAGASHTIFFEYIGPSNVADSTGSYVIDDVELNTRTPTAADGSVTGRVIDENGNGIAGAVVNLNGSQTRKFITDANGSYRFDNVETSGFYTVRPSRTNYAFSPAERSFSQLGHNTDALFTGTRDGRSNPLDTPEFFVRQHYLDFLQREPEEDGFNFWSDQMRGCGADSDCLERRTINVSAAYLLSVEFNRTGAFVDGLQRASFGGRPQFEYFMPDTRTVAQGIVVGRANWERDLAANRDAFLSAWVARPAFRAAYDNLGNAEYVDALISHTGVNFGGERDALVNSLNAGASRAEVLRQIAENPQFVDAKRNEMFVMMQYFGYLRRNPDAAGFNFWLNKLNQFDGNFERAEMVKAFLVSGEYRSRFQQ